MITFRKDFACWWPDYDHNPDACHRKVTKRITDMDIATGLAKGRKLCVQAGGHAGLWPRRLAGLFEAVYSFEPEPALFECMARNCSAVPNIWYSRCALGASIGEVKMCPHPSAGSWRVGANGTVPVRQITIDSLHLPACDAIFLDIEGYEPEALTGATETIAKFHPVLHLEVSDRTQELLDKMLRAWGYVRRAKIHSDVVYQWNSSPS